MGVTGLWRLIEPAGKPVPVETLENKVLAVDISIWLHQMVKGYQDAKGAPLPNAHLMGLFQRICKLLYFRIKPVFVFDGSYPELKKETIAKRQDNKLKYNSQSAKLKREIAVLLGKQTAINSLLGNQISPKKSKPVEDKDELFKLPALPALPEKDIESESESDEDEENSSASTVDLHSVDLESDKFQNMPLKEKYDLLIELKETRKMNSWGKIHTLPKKSDNFSDFQMQRLLKRRKLQECLVETEKEIGDGGMSLNELESLLNEEGIDTKIESLANRRIASNNTTRYLLISNVKQAIADAKKKETESLEQPKNQPGKSTDDNEISPKKDELEDDLQKAIKMSLECVNEAETSENASKTDDSWTSLLTDTDYSDCEDDDGFEPPDMTSAKAYIMQYSDFTSKAIDNIVASKIKEKNKCKETKIDKIIEELNNDKSIIKDIIELTSSDEEQYHHGPSYQMDKTVPSSEVQILCNESDASKHSDSNETADIYLNKETKNKTYFNMNDTQASVVCVENSMDDIISLESSAENVDEIHLPKISKENTNMNYDSSIQSETSDDDFEEVSNSENSPKKPVIELTLEMGKEVEDDIFADIFQGKVMVSNINQSTPTHSDNKEKKPTQQSIPNFNQDNKIINVQVTEQALESKIDKKVKPIDETLNKEPAIKFNDNKSQNTEHPSQKSSTKIKCTDTFPPTLEAKAKDELQVQEPSTILEANNKDSILVHKSKDSILVVENKDSILEARNKDSILEAKNKDSILEFKNNEPISIEQLNTLMTEIETEKDELLQDKGRFDRIGRNITEQMTKEAQELLQVFGIPYIVAPMEAEAQCAFLESVKLTDGTITDDSDIWLFGGRTVYKNFFNQKKHVLQFLSERIEKSYNLTREQLVLLALLVGSDYTTGVNGVGPVTALEILASFPFSRKKMVSESSKQAQYQELVTGLQQFKKWIKAGKRTDNISLKKKLKNVSLSDEFPSVRVVHAYLEPNVERNEEKFTWGEIDITILRDYVKTKFGWSQNKLDEIIKPVLKRMLEHKSQKNIHDFFKRKIEFQSLEDQMSKRVKEAVQRMGPDESSVQEISGKTDSKNPKKRKTKDSNEKAKQAKKMNETENIALVVKTSVCNESEKKIEINIPKSSRVQEIIPQRENDKKSLLENKLKAIEIFRKTKIDCKKKPSKRKLPVPKEKAELSESDSD